MNNGLLVGGGVCGAVSAILMWQALKAQKELDYMQRMNATAREVSHGVMAELTGKAVPVSSSLKAPKSGQDCVYYRFHVERREQRTDKNGTRYDWVTVTDSAEAVPFFLDDGTDKVLLDLSGQKDVDALKSFEAVENNPGVSGKVMGFNLSIGNQPMRYTEHCIPVGQLVYAMGLIRQNESGASQLIRPPDERPFVVSTKSEEMLKQERKGKSFASKVGAAVFGIAAVALFYYGFTGQ
ncbi:MAG: GIDE domain-containing protein [Candidatus Micrarchaeota archaeon]